MFIMPHPVTILFKSGAGCKGNEGNSEQKTGNKPSHKENLLIQK